MRHFLHLFLVLLSTTLLAQNTYNTPIAGDLVIEDCSGILYDSGGADGDYTNDELGIVSIMANAGDLLSLTFTEFNVENSFDYIVIYDGPDTNSPVIGFFFGSEQPNNGEPILSSGSEVTIVFQSDFSITGSGYAIAFDCIDFTDPPIAAAGFPSISCTGTVAFADASTFFPTTWEWSFGDGGTSTEQNPTHTYVSPGTYDIELTVCNDNGCDTFTTSEAITFDPDSFACTNGFNMTYQAIETTSLCNGILYDNGGVEGDYLEGSFDQFLIAPPGATAITLTFTAFDLGSTVNNHDQLYIFAGDDTFFNPLAVYTGTDLPNNGQPITFDVSSVNIYFSSDHFDNNAGFAIIWEANGSANPPVAAFSADVTTVPFGTAVQFTDESTENPGGWQWDFGDGATSNEQNPSHVFNQAGTFEVTLSVTNCNDTDITTPLFITVQEPPALSVDPGSFTIEIDAGTSTTETLNLCNEGLGDLISTTSTLGDGTQAGYIFEFTTSETVVGLAWQVLDINFEVIAESTQEYFANTSYTEVISGLEAGAEYYFTVVNFGEDSGIASFTLTDLGTGTLFFEGFADFVGDLIYIFPSPMEGAGIGTTWLELTEATNPLSPDACEALTVTFDATNLIDGTYEGSITIASNDPDNPSVTVPVTLIVNGTPALTISANDLDFGEIQVGGSSDSSFELENTGTAAVEISGLLSDDPNFVVQSNETLTIEPFQSTNISVTFTPSAIASFSETLTLVNNAGDDVAVNLTGAGVAAPSLTINPTEFTVELISGENTDLTVDIGNVGEAVLEYEIVPFSSSTGFVFNFTTDTWGSEFSWILFDSNGQLVQSSAGTFYDSNTDYSVALSGLSSSETYTLLLQDSWGDGALPSYSVVDALSG
ncbi:MAG: PKD domain-containing protein, partial [Bacteroidota bacterium]